MDTTRDRLALSLKMCPRSQEGMGCPILYDMNRIKKLLDLVMCDPRFCSDYNPPIKKITKQRKE